MHRRFQQLVSAATIGELTAQGYLVPARYFAPKAEAVAEALDSVRITAVDYNAGDLAAAMKAHALVGDVVGTWQRLGGDRQTICFAVDKAHARLLCDEFVTAGVSAEVILDETPDDERTAILAAFEARQTRVLCSVGVLSIGFDSPIASCAILARPTLSLSLFVQQGGRVLRPYAGKTDAIVLDHACNTLRHGLLHEFEPPGDLSEIDKGVDKAKRRDAYRAWTCRHCETVNALGEDFCVGCGNPRRRNTVAVVVDGQLVRVDAVPGGVPAGPTVDDIYAFYAMARWHGEQHGLSIGWAYYATQRRFKFDNAAAKRFIAWGWRDDPAQPPDAAAARWFRADFLRGRYARRCARQDAA